jgi:hypothetical protein
MRGSRRLWAARVAARLLGTLPITLFGAFVRVTALPDENDGRVSFAVLTARGKDALRRAWPVYREAIHRHLGAHLTAEQCRELAALLGQAAAGAETFTVAGGQPKQGSY